MPLELEDFVLDAELLTLRIALAFLRVSLRFYWFGRSWVAIGNAVAAQAKKRPRRSGRGPLGPVRPARSSRDQPDLAAGKALVIVLGTGEQVPVSVEGHLHAGMPEQRLQPLRAEPEFDPQ